MNVGEYMDSREIAQSIKGRKPPYECPVCLKEYRSATGILYHIGMVGPPRKMPRCTLGDYTPQASPRPSPSIPASPGGSGTPSTVKRKAPRRDLTWAEAQRLVEVEFESCYKRIEIENDLDVSLHSDEEDCDGITYQRTPAGGGASTRRSLGGPRTPQQQQQQQQKRGKGGRDDPSPSKGKSASKSKNKGKRKSSKLKTSQDGQSDSSSLPVAMVSSVDNIDFADAPTRGSSYFRFVEQSAEDMDEMVEYDMDEEDYQWLSLINEERKSQGFTSVPQEAFETLMDRLEKECFFESHTTGPGLDQSMYNIDENAVCCICNDGECHNTNAILFCDMCNLAVHQECYGVPYIPEGQWLCRRCLHSPSRGVDCVLCPNKGGAFKQTVDARWAHMICAIWIPEVQFSNPVFLEPIDGTKEIPAARWKLTCYVCRQRRGACIQCAKANCYTAFHVTCAQQAGLHMKIEMLKGGEIRKTAYCDAHTPPTVKKRNRRRGGGGAKRRGKFNEGKIKIEKVKEPKDGGGGGSGDKEKASSSSDSESEKDRVGGMAEGKEGEEGDGGGGGGGGGGVEGEGGGEGSGGEDGVIDAKSGVAKVRQIMEERRSSMQPVVNIPYVPQHRLDRISARVALHKKSQFIPKLVSYWKLKRQSRNGVPLLRRLQASNQGQRTATANLTEEEKEVLAEQLAQWKSLRHDLERARMLVELVRKREKLKREQLRVLQRISELKLRPLNTVMRRVLDRLGRKDPADIFAEPVPIEDVPDYLDVIKYPMDFSTMRGKVEANEYPSLDAFEHDFTLVWKNATVYNQKDTVYYRAAIRIRDAGTSFLQTAYTLLRAAGVDRTTGLHSPPVQEPPPLASYSLPTIATSARRPGHLLHGFDDGEGSGGLLEEEEEEEEEEEGGRGGGVARYRDRLESTTSLMSLEDQIEIIQEKIEMVQTQCPRGSRKAREKALRKELQSLRRQQHRQQQLQGGGGGGMEAKATTIFESGDFSNPNSPSRKAGARVAPNAEELASHVLHGSLRLTPSRQQILSYSGISLPHPAEGDEGEEEEEEEDRGKRMSLRTGLRRRRLSESPAECREASSTSSSSTSEDEDGDDEREPESQERFVPNPPVASHSRLSDDEEEEEEEEDEDEEDENEEDEELKRSNLKAPGASTSSRSRRNRSSGNSTTKRRRNRSSTSRRQAQQQQQQPPPRSSSRRSSAKWRAAPPPTKRRKKPTRRKKSLSVVAKSRRVSDDDSSSLSEMDLDSGSDDRQVNGFRSGNSTRGSGALGRSARRNLGRATQHVMARELRPSVGSSSSNNYETAEEFLRPPRSVRSSEKQQTSASGRGTPSNSVDDSSLLRGSLVAEGCGQMDSVAKRQARKRKHSPESERDKAKKSRSTSDRDSDSIKKSGRTINGLVNGANLEFKPMDLVWAKCRGYPSYPALVIDPDISSKGFKVNGEEIQPSDEVLSLREKNTYLVRFFDGRRTWQWLPPDKVEPLGRDSEMDNVKLSTAGSSKRGVKEAYQRATRYQKHIAAHPIEMTSINSSSDSEDDDSDEGT